MYYIYVLKCVDNTLYTGIASDVRRRFSEHCAGKKTGAKYTRAHKPECIEAVWSVATRSQALRVEAYIKKKTKEEKINLFSSPHILDETFPKSEGDSCIKPEPEYIGYK